MKNTVWVTALLSILFVVGCNDDTDDGPGPVASFTYSGERATPATITVNNTSQYADVFYWNPGDYHFLIEEEPELFYPYPGNYIITLIAEQSWTGRRDTAWQEITIIPTKLYLDRIVLEEIPFTDSTGADWDSDSGPDVFIVLVQESTVLMTCTPSLDITPESLPVQWTMQSPFRLYAWDSYRYLRIYEYDGTPENDLIGTLRFLVDEIIEMQGYIYTVELVNEEGTIRAKLALHWE